MNHGPEYTPLSAEQSWASRIAWFEDWSRDAAWAACFPAFLMALRDRPSAAGLYAHASMTTVVVSRFGYPDYLQGDRVLLTPRLQSSLEIAVYRRGARLPIHRARWRAPFEREELDTWMRFVAGEGPPGRAP